MPISITAQRNELSAAKVLEFEEVFRNAGYEFFRTGDNFNTLTFEVGEIDGKPVYGSLKFTLHKDNYNLDDEIESYEMKLEERARRDKEKEAKKAKQLKEQKLREEKAEEKRKADERVREKRRAALGRVEEEG